MEVNIAISQRLKEIFPQPPSSVDVDKLSAINNVAKMNDCSNIVFIEVREECVIKEFLRVVKECNVVISNAESGYQL